MVPMRQMAAMSQVQAENRVARLEDRRVSRLVRLRTRMWLDIGMFRAKQFLPALAGQFLDHVSEFASAVITFSRVPFRIFIREHRAGSLEHRLADKVLRSNQLQPFMLAANFVIDGGRNLRITLVK